MTSDAIQAHSRGEARACQSCDGPEPMSSSQASGEARVVRSDRPRGRVRAARRSLRARRRISSSSNALRIDRSSSAPARYRAAPRAGARRPPRDAWCRRRAAESVSAACVGDRPQPRSQFGLVRSNQIVCVAVERAHVGFAANDGLGDAARRDQRTDGRREQPATALARVRRKQSRAVPDSPTASPRS